MTFESFKGKRFTSITASANSKFVSYYEGVPAVLKRGKKNRTKGGFFDYNLIRVSQSKIHIEIDKTTNEAMVGLEPDVFRDTMDTFIKEQLPPATTSSFSASFFRALGDASSNLPAGEKVAILAGTFEEGSTDDGIGVTVPPTASFSFSRYPGILNPGTLVLKNESVGCLFSTFKFGNDSSYLTLGQRKSNDHLTGSAATTNLTRSFDKRSFHYIQDDLVEKWSIKFIQPKDGFDMTGFNGSDEIVGYALTSSATTSADFGVIASGSSLATNISQSFLLGKGPLTHQAPANRGYLIPYNGLNQRDSVYNQGQLKGFISGEGLTTADGVPSSSEAYLPNLVYVYYTSSIDVNSGSFRYASESQGAAFASSSGGLVELFYPSASFGTGPSGSYTGSFIGNNTKYPSGSHIFLNKELTLAANPGFYAIPGTNEVLGAFIGYSTIQTIPGTGLHFGISSSVSGNNVPFGQAGETVPRFTTKSIHGMVALP